VEISHRADQPRERLWSEGVEALSAVELLALVLRTGARGLPVVELARELLEGFGSLERLARAGDAELAALSGLGPAKIAAVRAALELGARATRAPLRAGERLLGPEQVFAHLGARLGGLRQERFLALLLDSRHRVIREVEVSRGSLDQSLVHPREVFGPALRESAAALVVAHNHPSGDPEPSPEDREVTCRLVSAGQILGVSLLDHVVLGGQGYVSFARRGWLQAQVAPEQRR
jgi:DNA repair protein RadC